MQKTLVNSTVSRYTLRMQVALTTRPDTVAKFIEIDKDGNKYHYCNSEMTILHREDGPAIESADGDKEWYLNGKRHRKDGPAVEYANGAKSWYLNGKRLTKEEFHVQ